MSFIYAIMLNPGAGRSQGMCTESGHWDGNVLDRGSNQICPAAKTQESGMQVPVCSYLGCGFQLPGHHLKFPGSLAYVIKRSVILDGRESGLL